MIKGFEKETHPLTKVEESQLPLVVERLKKAKGKQNSAVNQDIIDYIVSHGFTSNSARIRKLINHIRTNGLVKHLISTSLGYYIATNKKEYDSYILSLEQRISAITEVRDALITQRQYFNE